MVAGAFLHFIKSSTAGPSECPDVRSQQNQAWFIDLHLSSYYHGIYRAARKIQGGKVTWITGTWNLSISVGRWGIPDEWHQSTIILLYKRKRFRSKCCNYRHVTCFQFWARCLHALLARTKPTLLSDRQQQQSGFAPGCSTCIWTALHNDTGGEGKCGYSRGSADRERDGVWNWIFYQWRKMRNGQRVKRVMWRLVARVMQTCGEAAYWQCARDDEG